MVNERITNRNHCTVYFAYVHMFPEHASSHAIKNDWMEAHTARKQPALHGRGSGQNRRRPIQCRYKTDSRLEEFSTSFTRRIHRFRTKDTHAKHAAKLTWNMRRRQPWAYPRCSRIPARLQHCHAVQIGVQGDEQRRIAVLGQRHHGHACGKSGLLKKPN